MYVETLTGAFRDLRSRFLILTPHCHYCSKRSTTTEFKIPPERAGEAAFTWWNLTAVCDQCAKSKTRREEANADG